jgi:hypothetical protein
MTKTPMGYSVTPIIGTIQWISDLAVHPKMRMPIGGRKQLAMAGRRTCSGYVLFPARVRGSCGIRVNVVSKAMRVLTYAVVVKISRV